MINSARGQLKALYYGKSVDKLRVLLSNEFRLFHEGAVDLIQRQADMEIVGVGLDNVELLLMAGEARADVVVVNLPDSGEDPGTCSHLLAEYPELLILAISSKSNEAFSYRRVILKEKLSVESEEEIMMAIRQLSVYMQD